MKLGPGSRAPSAARLCLDSILIFLVHSTNISRAAPLNATLRQILRSVMQNLNIAEIRRENFYERCAVLFSRVYIELPCNSKTNKNRGKKNKKTGKRNLLLKAYETLEKLRRDIRRVMPPRCFYVLVFRGNLCTHVSNELNSRHEDLFDLLQVAFFVLSQALLPLNYRMYLLRSQLRPDRINYDDRYINIR